MSFPAVGGRKRETFYIPKPCEATDPIWGGVSIKGGGQGEMRNAGGSVSTGILLATNTPLHIHTRCALPKSSTPDSCCDGDGQSGELLSPGRIYEMTSHEGPINDTRLAEA